MREVKVDLASLAEDLADLLNFDAVQLGVQIEATKLRNKEFEVRSSAIRISLKKVWVQSNAHEQIICVLVVPVQLDEGIKDLAIDEALFLQCFERMAKVLDNAAFTTVFLSGEVVDQTATKQVVCNPEDWPEDGEAAKVLLVYLL